MDAISDLHFLVDFFNFLKKYTWWRDSQYLISKLWLWAFWFLTDRGMESSGTEQQAWNKFVTLALHIRLILFVNIDILLLHINTILCIVCKLPTDLWSMHHISTKLDKWESVAAMWIPIGTPKAFYWQKQYSSRPLE